jgi:hypothetical protein
MMVFSSLLGSRNGVVSSENLKGKHLSTFLWTPHEHDVPKLHAKFILLHIVKLVIAF